MYGRADGKSISRMETDDRPWLFSIDGRRTKTERPSQGRIQTTDSVGRSIKNIKMWTEVDGWTDESSSVEAWRERELG